MSKRDAWRLVLLAAAALPAAAQETRQEFRPEVDLYINTGERTRFLFRALQQQAGGFSQGNYLVAIDLALRPLFRRELREREDVFRQRFLSFRAGYQYSTTFVSSSPSSENRAIAELTARYPLPKGFVLIDRNRGDFRWVRGKPFSTRYRNRLWLERDLKLKAVALTPYVFDEIYYDTRSDAWSTNRFGIGFQAPVGPHVVLEPYFSRQENSRSTPRYTNALGFKLNLYF